MHDRNSWSMSATKDRDCSVSGHAMTIWSMWYQISVGSFWRAFQFVFWFGFESGFGRSIEALSILIRDAWNLKSDKLSVNKKEIQNKSELPQK